MVNEQIMLDTVKRMLEAGIDDPTIISTLTDAGLSNEQCLEIISKVKEPAVKETVTPTQPNLEVQSLRNAVEAQSEAQDLHAETTSTILDDHEQKIAQVNNKVDSIESKISSNQNKPDGTLSYRLSMLEQKLQEVNSASKAQLDLMQKILEINRKVLTELEAKK
jgi:uncharacterized protein YqgV (UPF0045/DUF77 family)